MDEELRIKLLGSPAVSVGDEPLGGFVSVKAQALLFYLAATRELHRRDALAALLWSDAPEAVAKKNLRDVLFNLRRLIGPFLLITRQIAGLNPEATVTIDSHSLWQTLQDIGGNTRDPAPKVLQDLTKAANGRAGEFLSGFYVSDAPLFEEWMLGERERLRRELGAALEKLAEYALGGGDYTAAEAYAQRQLELDGYREKAHRQLMTALALSDRRAEAVAHYEALAALLRHELGLEPARPTRELMGRIRAGEMPVVSSARKHAKPVDSLPLQLTSFVGRERELSEIKRLLEKTRLLTLAGAGGSGKTRLAIQVAAQVAPDYDDGVTFVSLASTKNPARVVNAVAQELNVLELPDRSLEETLGRFLARKQKLLILDNFEHVLEAALLVSRLLRAAPRLTVLVTSREALRLYGEHAYMVPPLALPDMVDVHSLPALAAVDAIDLFVQRAHMVAHDFALTEDNAATVAAICRRLDGLPLAIELAAARIKLFSPHDLLQKLDDRLGLLVDGPRDVPRRQQALKATIEWSYNLLSLQERQILTQLAVFNGGCTLAASEAVCACGKGRQLLLALESLLNKNLLFQKPSPSGERRFYMLETIHEYARERLRASGEERLIGNRHLDYYLDLVEEMTPGYMRQRQLALFKRTGEEIDNIRNAFTWALSGEQIEKAARLLTAINYYLRYRSKYVLEGYRLSKQLLPDLERISPQYRIPFLISTAELAFHNNDPRLFGQLAQQAQSLARVMGEEELLASSLVLNIDFEGSTAGAEKAVQAGKEALALFRKLDNKPGMAYTLNRLGEIHRLCGHLDQAKRVYNEALALCWETGEVIRQDILKANLAGIAYLEGNYQRAKDLLMPTIRHEYRLDWMHANISDYSLLSGILACLGQPEKAARIRGACHKLRSELGLADHPYDKALLEHLLDDIRGLLDEATFAEAWAEGQRMTYEQLQAYVLTEVN